MLAVGFRFLQFKFWLILVPTSSTRSYIDTTGPYLLRNLVELGRNTSMSFRDSVAGWTTRGCFGHARNSISSQQPPIVFQAFATGQGALADAFIW